MTERTAEMRDTSLLSAAVVLGVVVSMALSPVGLPLAAMGIAGLTYRGRAVVAAVSSAIGVAGVAILEPTSVIFVAPALVAVFLAVVMLVRVDAQWVGAMLTFVIGAAAAARDFVFYRASGSSITAELAQEINRWVAQNAQSAAGAGGERAVRETANMLLSLIPMMYFFTGLITAVVVIIGIRWAANRSDRTVKVPTLSHLDLTPHVLWPFIFGLFALAASYGPVANPTLWRTVGLNLVLCVRALFALQGFGVAAGVLDRTRVGLGGRILALAALAVIDVFTLAVSFIGLIDFWVNFRRLPRDGATPSSPAAAVSDR